MNIYEHTMVGQPIDRGNFFVYSVYDNVGNTLSAINSDFWNWCNRLDGGVIYYIHGKPAILDLLRGLQIIERLIQDEYI